MSATGPGDTVPETVALKRMGFEHIIWLYFWIAPHVLLVAVAAVMFRKGLHKTFPIFFSYLVFEFLQFCLLFSVYYFRVPISIYLKIDMFSRAGSIALRFGMIQELFQSPVAHSVPLRRAMGRTLNWMTAFLVVLAAVFIGSLYYSIPGHHALQSYVSVEALNAAQCGLIILVFLWYRFLGLKMSPFIFGVALGLGMVPGLEPLMHVWKDSLTTQNGRIVDILQMAVFHGAVLIWLYFAQARDKTTSETKAAPLLRASEWAADLGRITHL